MDAGEESADWFRDCSWARELDVIASCASRRSTDPMHRKPQNRFAIANHYPCRAAIEKDVVG
jgi:hypothetical protein